MQDGSIQVLAIAHEDSASFIRKGAVYNIDKTVLCLKSIKAHLQSAAGRKIARAYVCFGGQGMHSVRNAVRRQFEMENRVSQELVDSICEENRSQCLPEYFLLDVVTLEYRLGAQSSMSPVGVLANGIEGRFLNIVVRRSFYNNIMSCLEQAGIEVAGAFATPVILADAVLNVDSDKRPGCALVDFGKDTTTVAVYHKNILRHLAVIPLGSGNVTKDIAAALSIEEAEAESLKLKYATAYTDPSDSAEDENCTLKDSRTVSRKKLCEIAEARMEEILVNVSDQITASKVKNTLIAGAVLTGGGANMPDIEKAFAVYTNIEKIKFAKSVNFAVSTRIADAKAKDGTRNAVLGLLASGRENCASADIGENAPDLFPDGETAGKDDATSAGQSKDGAAGSQPQPPVKEDPEAARKREAEERAERERIRAERQRRREEWKRNNPFIRAWRKLAQLATNLVSPDDE